MNEEQQIKIIQYLEGELNPSERSEFERQLEADEDLRNELSIMKKVLRNVEISSVEVVRTQISKIEKELDRVANESSSNSTKMSRKWLSGSAASSLILIGIWWFAKPTEEQGIIIENPTIPPSLGDSTVFQPQDSTTKSIDTLNSNE
jgi:anti-sigma-K factor RskA